MIEQKWESSSTTTGVRSIRNSHEIFYNRWTFAQFLTESQHKVGAAGATKLWINTGPLYVFNIGGTSVATISYENYFFALSADFSVVLYWQFRGKSTQMLKTVKRNAGAIDGDGGWSTSFSNNMVVPLI